MTSATLNADLQWNTDSLFPSLASPEFLSEFDGVVADIADLAARFDGLGIRRDGPTGNAAPVLAELLGAFNAVQKRLGRVSAYIQAFVTTDAKNDLAQGRASELATKTVVLGQLHTRLSAWVGGLGDLAALVEGNETLRAHAFVLERMKHAAEHQMSPDEEELASLLALSGSVGWGKLHGNISSRLLVPFRGDRLPMTAVRNLAADPDAAVREEAHRAEIAAWRTVEVPLAAAMNGIKGAVNVLNARRGYHDAVEPTLFGNSIDAETLAAMQRACVASFPDFRRYFRAKARLLGKEKLAFHDLMAPVGKSERAWGWDEAQAFVIEQFGRYSEKLANLARRAFDERWIDVMPREGKRGGAFCMGWQDEVSRVLLNYRPDLDSVSTLAHELGHAYHNLVRGDLPPLQRWHPMTLAETASIFCETIAVNAALADAGGEEKLSILETQLQGHAQVVVDIHSRFLFEKAVFEKRAERDLSPQELCDLMLRAQRDTYGDGLSDAEDDLHPYMWAAKPHYYGTSFYNYPYTFGLLFGMGLYAVYQRDPAGFQAGYDDLLRATGTADAATLAARFGIDIRDEAFWTASLDVIRANIDEYEKLAPQA